MDGSTNSGKADLQRDTPAAGASQEELRSWVEQATGGVVARWQRISGGNRCQSWAVDVRQSVKGPATELYLRYQPPRPPSAEPYTVWREARVYQALQGTVVPAPKLVAVHPEHEAFLTERVKGQAEYRRLANEAQREVVAQDFVRALAALHQVPINGKNLPGYRAGSTLTDYVRMELEIWRAMYLEVDQRDPLIDLALDWLIANVPESEQDPALVHGDAGPGNFLFEDGRMTALLDWELAHIGDPMEDLAWFSMRSVMEPVPNFAALLRLYEEEIGRPIDLSRVRYHRVFVSTRVVIIRHRNVTGEPGNSIVSGALNRRLLVTALGEANGVQVSLPEPVEAPPTDRTELYAAIISDLRHEVADISKDASVVAAAKNAAKVLKYLQEYDRIGELVQKSNLSTLEATLGTQPVSILAGQQQVLEAARAGTLPFDTVIQCFASCVMRESQLAAPSSGGLATRQFPPLTS